MNCTATLFAQAPYSLNPPDGDVQSALSRPTEKARLSPEREYIAGDKKAAAAGQPFSLKFFALKIGAITIFFALLSASCSRSQRAAEAYNAHGGKTRANNYEAWGSFTSSLTFQEETQASKEDKTHKFAGAATALVPLSFATSYVTTSDGFIARVTSKILDWRLPFDERTAGVKALAAVPPVTDKADNPYCLATDGALYAFSADGKRRWRTPLFTPEATGGVLELLALSDGIVAARSTPEGGEIIKVRHDGTMLWRRKTSLPPLKMPAATEKETILVSLSREAFGATDSVLAIAPDGGALWAVGLERVRLLTNPVVAPDNKIYVAGIRDSANQDHVPVLIALGADGKRLWIKELPALPQGIAAADTLAVVTCAAGGLLGSTQSRVVAFASTGAELWRAGFENSIISPPFIGAENIAFLASKGAATGVYFIKRDGSFSGVFSLGELPPVLFQPAIDYDCNIVFATANSLGLARVGRSPVQKLVPY